MTSQPLSVKEDALEASLQNIKYKYNDLLWLMNLISLYVIL